MNTVGVIATILAVFILLGVIILGAISVSDIRRYLQIRKM
jgi:hypothetical protein